MQLLLVSVLDHSPNRNLVYKVTQLRTQHNMAVSAYRSATMLYRYIQYCAIVCLQLC